MEWSTRVEFLPALGLGVALAACAGLRAFLPLLLAGILARMGWLDLGPSFQFLASNRALVVFGVASLVEILGDKIPAVDHALDALGTPLRPAAAALLSSSLLGHVSPPPLPPALRTPPRAPAPLLPPAPT